MKFEQYLREHDVLGEFLVDYSNDKFRFLNGLERTNLECFRSCSGCCLEYGNDDCSLHNLGDTSLRASEYNKHFDSLLEEYKKTNPEEFI